MITVTVAILVFRSNVDDDVLSGWLVSLKRTTTTRSSLSQHPMVERYFSRLKNILVEQSGMSLATGKNGPRQTDDFE